MHNKKEHITTDLSTRQNGETSNNDSSDNLLHLVKAQHDPRAAALVAVYNVLYANLDSQDALDRVLRTSNMVPSDKNLCTELVYGVLRNFLRLESFAFKFLKKPHKLPMEMRLSIIICLFEMFYLRIPSRASVNWTVSHLKNRFGNILGGVANGALRAMQRDGKSFNSTAPNLEELVNNPAMAEVYYSMPLWIINLWLEQYGAHRCKQYLEAANKVPPTGIRLNTAHPSYKSVKTNLIEELKTFADSHKNNTGAAKNNHSDHLYLIGENGLSYYTPTPFSLNSLINQGKASRQSGASLEIMQLMEPDSWPLPIWDCCTGRGGKSLILLERGIKVSLVSDPSGKRLKDFKQELQRLSIPEAEWPLMIQSFTEDIRNSGDFIAMLREQGDFGTILIDAPCSGLGTLSRHPEIRYRRSATELTSFVVLQNNILEKAWEHLKSCGKMIYITCTISKNENNDQVKKFLAKHPDAVLAKETEITPDSLLNEFFYGAVILKK